MKTNLRRMIACAVVLGTLQLSVASSLATEPRPAAAPPVAATTATPKIVTGRTALSPQELAKYEQKSAQTQPATNKQAAGASGNKTVWVVVGVAAVAGIIALAAGGGGGGGGGGY
jgi:hypothetical protein